MTTPIQPPVAGANDLQSSIDRLDNSITSLTVAVQGLNNGNGTSTSPAMSPTFAAQGVQFTGGGYAGAGGGSGGGGATLGSGGSASPFSSGGGSGGQGGTNPYSITQAVANAATSVVNGQFLLGAQQLNDQATINTYGYTQAGFWSASAKSTITTAFGGGAGAGMTTNNLAMSATDARNGASLLSQISGQANYTASAPGVYGRGNAPFQAAAGIGLSNPGLGMTGSASVAGAWYNAGTSYNLMQMGISSTPLQLGTGKANNLSSVEDAIGQRFNFQGYNSRTGTYNSQNLAANLNNPLFQMQIQQATGMTQQQYQQWSQSWAQENNWAQTGHTTPNQHQNEIPQYSNGSTQAQQGAAGKWLQSHGVSMSLLQSMTQAQAGQTATEAGGNAAFTSGLQAATGAVNKFTQALSSGIQGMAGTAGFAGAIGSLNASGVSGAGAGGVSNTIIAGIASAASSLSKDVSSFAADLTGYSTAAGSSGSSGNYGSGSAGSTNIGSTLSGHQGSVNNTGSDFTSSVNGATPAQAAAYGGEWGSYARTLFKEYNWSSSQWPYLAALWQAESGWNPNAYNPSGATGIPQALPGSKMASAGSDWRTNGGTQVRWGLGYVDSVYGSPQKAWDHEVINGWYADGTRSAKPGYAIVGERGPEIVAMSGGQQVVSAAKMAVMQQPSFATNSLMGVKGGSGLTIAFQNGAITINGSGGTTGYHTSGDVQSQAQQFVQALETALSKSTVLQNIAAGVTG
jgi:hypothetical protein